jgi:selenocysteine lyase/cysteine desulfurase
VSPLIFHRKFKRNEPTHVGCHGENARASFYLDNIQAEVDRFVEVVKEIQKFFGQ